MAHFPIYRRKCEILLHGVRFVYCELSILVPLIGTRLFTVYSVLKVLTISRIFSKMFLTHLCMRMVIFSGECKVKVKSTFYAFSFYINSLTFDLK